MKHPSWISFRAGSTAVVFHTLLISILLSFSLHAEEPDVKEITFGQNGLETQAVPYGRKFIVTGSTQTPSGSADLVQLVITNSNEPDPNDRVRTLSWVRGEGDNGTAFKILVPPLYRYGDDYGFELQLYGTYRPDEITVNRIFSTVLDSIWIDFEKGGQVNKANVERFIASSIDDVIRGSTGAGDTIYNVVNNAAKVSAAGDRIEFKAPSGILDSLARFASEQKSRSAELRRIREADTELRAITVDQLTALTLALEGSRRAYDAVIEAEEKPVPVPTPGEGTGGTGEGTRPSSGGKIRHHYDLPFTLRDIDAFRTAVERRDIDAALLEKFEDFSDQLRKVATSDTAYMRKIGLSDRDVLGKIVSALRKSYQAKAAIKGYETTLRNRSPHVVKGITDGIRNVFLKHRAYKHYAIASPSAKAEIDRLWIGTIVGAGGARLGGASADLNVFMYAGAKFYFGPVDPDLPRNRMYATDLSHWALTVGGVIGTLTYKSQQQADLFAGLKPMVGISYEPHPMLVFNLGAIFFRQPSINPLATNITSKQRVGAYLGLNFDIDLVNRIREGLKN